MKIEKISKHWIWAVLASIISLTGVFWQYKSTRHDLGGILNATFHNRPLNNRDSRTIIVCVDDTVQNERDIYITPTFDNQDEYSLRDFSLTYEIVAEDIKILPSEFVSVYNEGKKKLFFRYNQDVLQAHMDTKNPLAGFIMQKEIARCEIISKVSFDGAASLFEYRTDVWFVYKPNDNNLSFEYWKLNCKQKVFELIDNNSFDIYYFSKTNNPEYQFDILLNETNIKKKERTDSDKTQNTIQKLSNNDDYVFISKISEEEERTYADLEIEDYNVERGDSTIINIFFNQPSKKSGSYVLSYWIKDGWRKKTIYKHLSIKKGQNGVSFVENRNVNKISNPILLHQVSLDKHLEITKNYKRYFSAKTKIAPLPILCWSYDSISYYIRPFVTNEISEKFSQKAICEFFCTKPNLYEKFTNNFSYLSRCLLFSGVLILFALIFGLLHYYATIKDDREFAASFFLGWTFTIGLLTIVLFLVLLYGFIFDGYYYLSLFF